MLPSNLDSASSLSVCSQFRRQQQFSPKSRALIDSSSASSSIGNTTFVRKGSKLNTEVDANVTIHHEDQRPSTSGLSLSPGQTTSSNSNLRTRTLLAEKLKRSRMCRFSSVGGGPNLLLVVHKI